MFIWLAHLLAPFSYGTGFAQAPDTFDREIYGRPDEAILLSNASHDTVYHCEVAQDTFTVTNTGNNDLDTLFIWSDDFVGVTDPSYWIPLECVTFSPAWISELPAGWSMTVVANVYVPCGRLAQDYKGKIHVMDDDGYPHETIELWITVLPKYDIDIANNGLDLLDNTMYFAVIPGESEAGYFMLINPNAELLNVDPDSFGNADIDGFTYSLSSDLTGEVFDSMSVDLPQLGLISGGSADVLLTAYIDSNAAEGTYSGWVTVIGDTFHIEVSRDSFELQVMVGSVESIELGNASHDTVYHCEDALFNVTVTNTGNANLDNIIFQASGFCGVTDPSYRIPWDNVHFIPAEISELLVGETVTVLVMIFVPRGMLAQDYTGFVRAMDDDGYPSDAIELAITVLPMYDVEIADNEEDLVGNTMILDADLGEVTETKRFLTINPQDEWMNVDPDPWGNAGYDVTYKTTDLVLGVDTISSGQVTITPSASYLALGNLEVVALYVTIPNDTTLDEGEYTGKVRVDADTAGVVVSSDSFDLELYMGPEGVIESENASQDTVFSISHSQPNPLKNETIIKYVLPKSSNVRIVIYNLIGHEIKTLVNEKQSAGVHTVTWDGRNNTDKKVSSGAYFLKFEAVDFKQTEKIIMVE